MACRGILAKIILVVANVLYFIAGVSILTVGSIAIGSPSTLVNMLSYIPVIGELSKVVYLEGIAMGPAIYLIVVGCLVIIFSIVGGCSGVKKHRLITIIFGVATFLMMLFNLAIIMFYAIDPYYIQGTVEHNMRKQLTANYTPVTITNLSELMVPPTDESSIAWTQMEYKQSCCGVVGSEDYRSFTWNNNFSSISVINASVPPSCCLQKVQYQAALITDNFVDLGTCLENGTAYTNYKGCSSYVMQEITRYNFIIVCAAAALDGLQIIIITMSMYIVSVESQHGVGAV